MFVGHLDAHVTFAGHRRLDADARGSQGQRKVVGERGDLADTHASAPAAGLDEVRLHAELGYGGAAVDFYNVSRGAEGAQGFFDMRGALFLMRLVVSQLVAEVQHLFERRQHPGRLLMPDFDLFVQLFEFLHKLRWRFHRRGFNPLGCGFVIRHRRIGLERGAFQLAAFTHTSKQRGDPIDEIQRGEFKGERDADQQPGQRCHPHTHGSKSIVQPQIECRAQAAATFTGRGHCPRHLRIGREREGVQQQLQVAKQQSCTDQRAQAQRRDALEVAQHQPDAQHHQRQQKDVDSPT